MKTNPQTGKLLILLAIVTVEWLNARFPSRYTVEIAFVLAAVALFRFGHTLQTHSLATLRRFRISARAVVWFAAVVAFWYSTLVWMWWLRNTPTFPLYLLGANLEPRFHFFWVSFFVAAGLYLEARAAAPSGVHHRQ